MSLAVVTTPAPRRRPRDVLQVIQSLRQQNPRAGEDELAELLTDELIDDRELLLGVGRDLVRKALVKAKVRSKPTLKAAETARRQRVASQEAANQVVKAAVAAVKVKCVLDLQVTLLSGESKALRYVLGRELAELGGVYQAVAAKVGDENMVGEVLVEAELKALLQAAV
jgi:hypothetical protein